MAKHYTAAKRAALRDKAQAEKKGVKDPLKKYVAEAEKSLANKRAQPRKK